MVPPEIPGITSATPIAIPLKKSDMLFFNSMKPLL